VIRPSTTGVRPPLAQLFLLFFAVALCASPTRSTAEETTSAIRGIVESGLHPLGHGRIGRYQEPLLHAYERRAFHPLWVSEKLPTAQAKAAIDVFRHADNDGLLPSDYAAEQLSTELQKLTASAGGATARQIAAFDVALSVEAMHYASDSYRGRIDPRRVGLDLVVPPKRIDLGQTLIELAEAKEPVQQIAALAPPFPAYARLKEALRQTRELAARRDLRPLPALPRLHPGDLDADLPKLRALLTALGDLAADSPAPSDPVIYDEALVAAVRDFQKQHGVDADGIIGPTTLRQLRVPLAQRVEQIELGLERLRWLPYDRGERAIFVNIPEFRLRAFDAGQMSPTLAMNVVVGSIAKKNPTPILRADLRYIIFRPRWNVPDSITQKEMLPEMKHNPAKYFQKNDLEIISRSGEELPLSVDSLEQLSLHSARLRQRPGTKNSLGLVKFVFPNPNDIYFHDTPSKTLFQRSRRDFSHGCIRVADPVGLAEFALRGVDGWDRSRIEGAMQSTDPKKIDVRVGIKSPVAVYVLYTTVVADEDGKVIFLDDIYGHDAKLIPLLIRGA